MSPAIEMVSGLSAFAGAPDEAGCTFGPRERGIAPRRVEQDGHLGRRA